MQRIPHRAKSATVIRVPRQWRRGSISGSHVYICTVCGGLVHFKGGRWSHGAEPGTVIEQEA